MRSARVPDRGIGPGLASVVSTLLVAGCSGNARAPSVATSTRLPIHQLVAYSACLRGHGVPSFPDPNSSGNLVIVPTDHINPSSPQYERAEKACKRLSPEGTSGQGMTPAQHARALEGLTRYVQCMRRHSIPMADPFSGPNGGVGIALPRSVNPSSERYKQADGACKHFLPNSG